MRLEATPKGKPRATVSLAYVRPEMAVELLVCNTMNRELKPAVVERYANDMQNGLWHTTGIPIAIDWNGVLLNGQHTLNAIVRSGIPQWVFIARDIDPEAIIAFDDGKRRSFADNLHIMGHKYPAQIACCARYLRMYDLKMYSFACNGFSNSIMKEFLDENPDIVDAVEYVSTLTDYSKNFEGAGMLAFIRVITARYCPKKSAEFLDIVLGIRSAGGRNAATALRKRLLDARNEAVRTRRQMAIQLKIALYCKAFNLFVAGKDVQTLRFQSDEAFHAIPVKGATV